MLRTTKYFSIATTGTAQPLIGTTLGAAAGPNSNPDVPFILQVADSSMFNGNGDWCIVGAPSAGQERLMVTGVVDGTHIQVKGVLKNSYASGAFVRLSVQVNSTYVQTQDGNAAAIFIGTADSMSTSTFALCVAKLQNVPSGVQPTEWSDGRSGLANADDCGELWVSGTSGDKYAPTLGVL